MDNTLSREAFEEWYDPCHIGIIDKADYAANKLANSAWHSAIDIVRGGE